MKFKNILVYAAIAAVTAAGFTSCNYLDVVPPEQPKLSDTMTNHARALGFLHSCYYLATHPGTQSGLSSYGAYSIPVDYLSDLNSSTDEYVISDRWTNSDNKYVGMLLKNTLSASNCYSEWKEQYVGIAHCYQFLNELETTGAANKVADEEELREWSGEIDFLVAWYHFCLLRRYGPVPIAERERVSASAPISDYAGRYHYDYCVDWIANKLDEAADKLPATRITNELGRATSTMAKAVKARLLLYAASPLWNGEFPFKEWRNTNFETPGYGLELVSHTRDDAKWERALKANEEALQLATGAGERELYYGNDYRAQNNLPVPYTPVDDYDDEFTKAVMRMRCLVTLNETDGNHEVIWQNTRGITGNNIYAFLPHRILGSGSNWFNGYSGVAPTLYSMQNFLTKDGYTPATDPNFAPESEWYQSAGLPDEDVYVRSRIIKLFANREPRFYAWMGFDGGDYGSILYGGTRPVILDMKNSQSHGYNPTLFPRDYTTTGFLCQKYIHPLASVTAYNAANFYNTVPLIMMRLAELYLNIAECHAELGHTAQALENVNIIRERAGVPALTQEMVSASGKSVLDWVRQERFCELWHEGNRYFDVRRWMLGEECFGYGKRIGLNAMVVDPSFEEFNTPTPLPYYYTWSNRLYLYPVMQNEIYSNPQLVQAPGF